MTPRTPEERERAYKMIYEAQTGGRFKWEDAGDSSRRSWHSAYDNLLAAFPQLWDSLPPDPAEAARKEAEEDGMMLAAWRAAPPRYVLSVDTVARFIDRLVSRAAAGYPVLIAPKGEK